MKKTTEEDEQKNNSYFEHLSKKRSTQRQQHGGSLQDLPEALSNELYYTTTNYGSINSGNSGAYNVHGKRHQRQKKFSSSVSTRQREGGSLPCNVNVSTSQPASNDPPFLDEYRNKQATVQMDMKNNDTVIDIGDEGEKRCLLAQDTLSQANIKI